MEPLSVPGESPEYCAMRAGPFADAFARRRRIGAPPPSIPCSARQPPSAPA